MCAGLDAADSHSKMALSRQTWYPENMVTTSRPRRLQTSPGPSGTSPGVVPRPQLHAWSRDRKSRHFRRASWGRSQNSGMSLASRFLDLDWATIAATMLRSQSSKMSQMSKMSRSFTYILQGTSSYHIPSQ